MYHPKSNSAKCSELCFFQMKPWHDSHAICCRKSSCPGMLLCNPMTGAIRSTFSLMWAGGNILVSRVVKRIDGCFTDNSLITLDSIHLGHYKELSIGETFIYFASSGSCSSASSHLFDYFSSQRWWDDWYYVRHWFVPSVRIGVHIKEEKQLGNKQKACVRKTKEKQSRKKKNPAVPEVRKLVNV